ncbi:MAG: permease-like cell division protein FtsX [Candidatus Altimarinota bacterium]
MAADFSSEWRSWQAVFALRKGTIGFFSVLIVFLVTLFLVMVWEYQIFSAQISQLTNQVEVIAELNEDLGQEQVNTLQSEIQSLPMVSRVDFWSAERSSQYIDRRILSGYTDFLQKTQSDIPLQPLFRIQLADIQQKQALEDVLKERYPQQISLVHSLGTSEGDSFAQQFISQVDQSSRVFQVAIVLLLILLVGMYGYLVSFILSERSKGFHLTQVLHLSPPYEFFPALVMSTGLVLVVVLLGTIVGFMVVGDFLWMLMGALGILFFLVNMILVWFGRFVVSRWSLR